ncbi:MAG: tRNA (adenosine(37)-N6)-threonylcarbamoyltransferase complex ATPase subunit type 1 TsaE [Candidatus Pacebacteria bacterium]|nr:tRNA (adenosine(37)-N6)-threonylcarbamoyltransferase complex ATPase subunit type 1 TsaE [Candidatus Paceibacterota bacterium]
MLQIRVESEAAMARLGAALARQFRPQDVIALTGNLGSGKTVLARGMVREFCGRPDLAVASPTFSLVQNYNNSAGEQLWHLDLYRLKAREEAWELGLDLAFSEAITLIEWPEILGDWLPANHLKIDLQFIEDSIRLVTLTMTEAWQNRLAAVLAKLHSPETDHDKQ